ISAIIPEVIVEEGERGMADGIRDALPSDKIIDIDLSDENYIVPIDLTEVITKLGRKGASRFADEVTDFFGDMEKMARSKRYLKAAAKAAGGSLFNIKRILEDEGFRVSVIEQLLQEGNKRLA
ncbi:TPA: ATP-binding protein, partial [Bacillus mycoides]|nr:ATP-binding protein [Bacillus mycoides]